MAGAFYRWFLSSLLFVFRVLTQDSLKEPPSSILLKNGVEKISKKALPFTAILLTAITTALISCNQVLTVILTKQLCANIQPDKQKMAIDLENSSILIPALIPWSIAGAVPIANRWCPSIKRARCIFHLFGSAFIGWYVRRLPLLKERS